MKISIIITFYSNKAMLLHCLQALYNTIKNKSNIEIIIVNDNPTIDLSFIYKEYKNKFDIVILNMSENSGYSKACNYGIEHSKYNDVILMDCDIVPQENWLEEMLNTYKSIDNYGCVSANIIDMSSNTLFGYGFGILGYDTIHYFQKRPINFCPTLDLDFPIISSGCMLMPKSLYLKVGKQNEIYMNAFNDFELTYKNFQLGNSNRMSYKSRVFHRGHVAGNIRTNYYADSKSLFFNNSLDKIYEETVCKLSDIYKSSSCLNDCDCICVNFSNSLMPNNFIDLFAKVNNLHVLQQYNKRNIENSIIYINDFLTWDICRTNVPIIYFCNDYIQLKNNYYWFSNRINNNDIIFDIHANIINVKDIKI